MRIIPLQEKSINNRIKFVLPVNQWNSICCAALTYFASGFVAAPPLTMGGTAGASTGSK